MLSIIMSQHDIVIIIHAYLNNWPERTESLYIFAGRKSNLYFIDANHTVVFLLSGSKDADDEGQWTARFSSGPSASSTDTFKADEDGYARRNRQTKPVTQFLVSTNFSGTNCILSQNPTCRTGAPTVVFLSYRYSYTHVRFYDSTVPVPRVGRTIFRYKNFASYKCTFGFNRYLWAFNFHRRFHNQRISFSVVTNCLQSKV